MLFWHYVIFSVDETEIGLPFQTPKLKHQVAQQYYCGPKQFTLNLCLPALLRALLQVYYF